MSTLYYCTNENNTCPKNDECKRFLKASENSECVATLFNVACTETNGYVLFMKKESEEQ